MANRAVFHGEYWVYVFAAASIVLVGSLLYMLDGPIKFGPLAYVISLPRLLAAAHSRSILVQAGPRAQRLCWQQVDVRLYPRKMVA